MIHHLALLLMAPVFVVQGQYVRRNTPKLEEAWGPRSGSIGQGKPLRLLLIGDSAAAGVGVEHQSQALSGHLVNELADSFQLEWNLVAESGMTTKAMSQQLVYQPRLPYDIVIASLGVNDVTQPISSMKWIEQQKVLVNQLRQRFSCQQIILTKIPPMEKFPALPHPLGWYLGNKAKSFNRQLAQWVIKEKDCDLIDINHQLGAHHMATDGFHPGPAIYQYWGEAIAQVIKSRWMLEG
ncbi:SGNH/GDSL hydrolase family protein [uncultured Photobacterium sp.]|uniref:SGNH/GDSL hydrolase family protein n=1 Tax=uncultured Photobacterium sp. TaxID=173973 RepID=UPI0026201E40|nr:SGNH/GDSL hydrolase family protein [uncultured Photobacterium sp.]